MGFQIRDLFVGRQFESVCGAEGPDLPPSNHCVLVKGTTMHTAGILTSDAGMELVPIDGNGDPTVALSAQGITAQVGVTSAGQFAFVLNDQGHVTLAWADSGLIDVWDQNDPETSLQKRLARRAAFALRDSTLDDPIGCYEQPNTQGGLDLVIAKRNKRPSIVYSQGRAIPPNPQGLTAWTPRPLCGATSFGMMRRYFIFGGKSPLQALAYDVDTGAIVTLTNSTVPLMGGIAYWNQGRREVACVAADDHRQVGTGCRTYYEAREGRAPWTRGSDYNVPRASLTSAFSDPGGAQSPEVSGQLWAENDQQLIAWAVCDRASALAGSGGFACGMNGAVALGILGRPETCLVVSETLDMGMAVAETEVAVGLDGRSWYVIFESDHRKQNWSAWSPTTKVIGPIYPSDFI